jgi:DNA-directed RNA polymerase specialized sigma24 family protein
MKAREGVAGGKAASEALGSLEMPDKVKEIWEEEWQSSLLKICMELAAREVPPQTISAFELNVMKKWPAEKVAEELQISTNTVYMAKNKVLSLMRKHKTELEEI